MTAKIVLCEDGWRYYHVWSSLLDQEKVTDKKQHRADIAEAKKLYLEHRKVCIVCTPVREECQIT